MTIKLTVGMAIVILGDDTPVEDDTIGEDKTAVAVFGTCIRTGETDGQLSLLEKDLCCSYWTSCLADLLGVVVKASSL